MFSSLLIDEVFSTRVSFQLNKNVYLGGNDHCVINIKNTIIMYDAFSF